MRDSHVVPAFVARWIKDTSATGFLRGFHQPCERSQPLQCVADVFQAPIWADFLLEKADRVGQYRFNIFFTPAGVTSEGILPEGLSWYLLRAPDATPVYSQVRTAIYVKLPGMFFWTSVVPPDPGGWKGTKIAKHGTVRSKNQRIKEEAIGQFLASRIEMVFRRLSDLSPRQRQRIADAVRDNPERVEASLTIQALLDDERIRGENLQKS